MVILESTYGAIQFSDHIRITSMRYPTFCWSYLANAVLAWDD